MEAKLVLGTSAMACVDREDDDYDNYQELIPHLKAHYPTYAMVTYHENKIQDLTFIFGYTLFR